MKSKTTHVTYIHRVDKRLNHLGFTYMQLYFLFSLVACAKKSNVPYECQYVSIQSHVKVNG